MAWDTVTKRAETTLAFARREANTRFKALSLWASRLRPRSIGVYIVAANLASLAVMSAGLFLLSDLRQSLTAARIDSMEERALGLAQFVESIAIERRVPMGVTPYLDKSTAQSILKRSQFSTESRVRLSDSLGEVFADSVFLQELIRESELPPLKPPPGPIGRLSAWLQDQLERLLGIQSDIGLDERSLAEEVAAALEGEPQTSVRLDETGSPLLSVSVPIKDVRFVHGVVTIEQGGVDSIIRRAREQLMPFLLMAALVSVASAAALIWAIAAPLRRLAFAADRVKRFDERTLNAGDIAKRSDEIGRLARTLSAMTDALWRRIEDNERFAADVAHELKNPLTSLRSAVETLPAAKTDETRAKLLAVIQNDVTRLNRLITDISNASRLEAEMARAPLALVDLTDLLGDIVQTYETTRRDSQPEVVLERLSSARHGPLWFQGREDAMGRVFRNLIDNALSFSPPGRPVRVVVGRREDQAGRAWLTAAVEDEGPGVPPENLESIFARFYTSRPEGAKFGDNSGLGLAIAKQIVEGHKGRIWAENRPPASGQAPARDGEQARGGARFVVELPQFG